MHRLRHHGTNGFPLMGRRAGGLAAGDVGECLFERHRREFTRRLPESFLYGEVGPFRVAFSLPSFFWPNKRKKGAAGRPRPARVGRNRYCAEWVM